MGYESDTAEANQEMWIDEYGPEVAQICVQTQDLDECLLGKSSSRWVNPSDVHVHVGGKMVKNNQQGNLPSLWNKVTIWGPDKTNFQKWGWGLWVKHRGGWQTAFIIGVRRKP